MLTDLEEFHRCAAGVGFDRRLSRSGTRVIEAEKVKNHWWDGFTAGGGGQPAGVEEFDREGLERCCLWSTIKPCTTPFLCYISSWAQTQYQSKAHACLISSRRIGYTLLRDVLRAAPQYRKSYEFFMSLCFSKGAESTAVWLSRSGNIGCMQTKPSCWYIKAGLVITGVRVREDN